MARFPHPDEDHEAKAALKLLDARLRSQVAGIRDYWLNELGLILDRAEDREARRLRKIQANERLSEDAFRGRYHAAVLKFHSMRGANQPTTEAELKRHLAREGLFDPDTLQPLH